MEGGRWGCVCVWGGGDEEMGVGGVVVLLPALCLGVHSNWWLMRGSVGKWLVRGYISG